MVNALAAARWIVRSDLVEGASLSADDVVLDLTVRAWVIDIAFTDGATMLQVLQERLGLPDRRTLLTRTWSFAGATVVQRGRRVMVSEST